MAKTKISEYSTTNSDNTDIENINIAEGCAPSGINNAIRELMVHLKEFQTGASGDAFTFAGGTLMSGTNTISGAAIISGNINSSGTNTFSGSNVMSFSGGSSASPSIYFASDTNTGIFSPAADTIAFTEGGAESMRIDSSGNVGIGTSSPKTGLSLLKFGTQWTNNTTNSYPVPAGKTFLQVEAQASEENWFGFTGGYGATSGSANLLLQANFNNTNQQAGHYIGSQATAATTSVLTFGRMFGGATTGSNSYKFEDMRIDSSGNLGIGTTSPTVALDVYRTAYPEIRTRSASYTNTFGIDTAGGFGVIGSVTNNAFVFSTNNTERMRIDSSGNVGIGTSSPIRPLQVGAYGTGNGEIALASSTTGFGSILFGDGGTGTDIFRGYVQYNHTSDAMIFATAAIERARIDSSGNLLVGTTTAAARFTIGGTAASAASSTICRIGDADYTTDTVLSVSPGVVNFDGPGVVGGRFHISSGGEVRIAGTTDQGAYNLQVQGTGVWGAGAYVNGSDSRIKEDIAPIATGLSVVEKLNPVTYRYKEDWSKDQSTQTGFIAQELLVALQDTNYVDSVVQQGGEKGYYSVAYQNIIPILTKAIQEQQALITQLQADVAALKGTA
jgi:hypothetical protein